MITDDATAVVCPDCGARNRHQAISCRLCGRVLQPGEVRSRTQRKLLQRTDFLFAARENQRRTTLLVAMLLLIAALLGYLIGWNLELLSVATPAPESRPIALFSRKGMNGALALLALAAVWSYVAQRRPTGIEAMRCKAGSRGRGSTVAQPSGGNGRGGRPSQTAGLSP